LSSQRGALFIDQARRFNAPLEELMTSGRAAR
jgi:hypothetical protein